MNIHSDNHVQGKGTEKDKWAARPPKQSHMLRGQ